MGTCSSRRVDISCTVEYQKEMIGVRVGNIQRTLSMALFILLFLGVSTCLFAEENELLIFKPHPDSLQYNLSVKTHSELEVGSRRFGTDRGVSVDHEDIFVLSQAIKGCFPI